MTTSTDSTLPPRRPRAADARPSPSRRPDARTAGRPRHGRRAGLAVALTLAVSLAACSSDDTASPPSTAATTAAVAGPTLAADAGPGVVLVSPAEADAVLQAQPEAVVVDVRTPEEFATGHLAGAELIDINATDFAARIDALPRDTTYVLYCRSGNRSARAADLMRSLGFTSVYEVDGGVVAWTAEGLPLET